MYSAVELEDGVIRGKRLSYSVQSPFWPDDLEKHVSSGDATLPPGSYSLRPACGAKFGLDFSPHALALPDAFV